MITMKAILILVALLMLTACTSPPSEGLAPEAPPAEELASPSEVESILSEEPAPIGDSDTVERDPSALPAVQEEIPIITEPVSLSRMTDEEAAKLTGYLEKISQGWHEPSVAAANDILRDESRGPEAWDAFFRHYFSQHALTEDLRSYLHYPVFWWFSDTVHANLQQGLFNSLSDIIVGQTEAYLQTERSSLESNSLIVQSLINGHRFFNDMIHLQAPGVDHRRDILDLYESLITDGESVGLIYGTATIDLSEHPFAGAFRAQAQVNYLDGLVVLGQTPDQSANTLGLEGARRTILQNYGVLVIDNLGLSETQLQQITSILESIPPQILRLRTITVNDFLGNSGDEYQWLSSKTGVNVFGLAVGAAQENVFPSDAAPALTDVFSAVVVHEFNHVVNAGYVAESYTLRERQTRLLEQAGDDSMNYLRSMFEDDFFQQAPQEFFASISNQYFIDSANTLELGMSRLQSGRAEPLNQFLFFADVYSRGGASTLFYTLDTAGRLTTTEIPLVRNSDGRIEGLSVGNTRYVFELDDDGNVVSATQE